MTSKEAKFDLQAVVLGDVQEEEKNSAPAAAASAPQPDPEHVLPELPPQPDPRVLALAAEDPVERRKLIMKIHNYWTCQEFSAYLRSMRLTGHNLDVMLIPEMQNLLRDIKFTVSQKNVSTMVQTAVPQLIYAAEPLISRYYDVRGTAAYLMGSQPFRDLLAEVALDSQDFVYGTPMNRLCFEICKTMFMVHESNKIKQLAGAAAKEVPTEKLQKMADLI